MNVKRYYPHTLLLVIFALFFLSPVWYGAVPANGKVDTLTAALAATGASVHELSINGWAKLPLPEMTDDEMAGVIEKTMAKLGLKSGQYQLTHHRSENHRQVRAESLDDKFQALAVLQVLYPVWEQKGHEVYLVIQVDKPAAGEGAAALQDKIYKVISGYGGSARVTTCLVGLLDGKLEESDKLARLNQAFAAIEATITNKLQYPNVASYSGFTPQVSDWLTVGQDRININMAIRYSEYDNRTYVLAASPVIIRDY